MKEILVLLSILLAFNVDASIVCKKKGRYWYPNNAKSIKIASMLGVKTCNGQRFKDVVKQLNETSNVTTKKRYKVSDIVKALR